MIEPGGVGTLVAILAMAGATFAMRAGGFWVMAHVPLTARLRRILEAMPGAVVVATVLPIAVREGLPALLAIAAAGAAMMIRRNDFLAVVAGMTVAALVRALMS
jgi:branched chain amino acid efflux pump